MSKDQILNRLTEIGKKVFNDPQLELKTETNANDIEAWDSITNLFFIDNIEAEFSIKFSLEDIMNANSIGDLCEIISKKVYA